MGQNSLADIDHAEEIYLKLPLGIRRVRQFDRTRDAKARVVDQNINLTGLAKDLLDCRIYRAFRGHVTGDMSYSLRTCTATAQGVDPAAGFLQCQCGM